MKFQKSCFWILICGIYLVCNSAAFGHSVEGYPHYLPAGTTADTADTIIALVSGSLNHSFTNSSHNPRQDPCERHEHTYDVTETDTATSTSITRTIKASWNCVTSSNSAPTFTSSGGTVTSDGSPGTIGTYTATDPDNDTLTYTISGPTYFSVNSSGELRLTKTLSAGTPDQTVIIVVQDGKGGSDSITLTVTILVTSTQTVVNNGGVSNQGSNTQTVIPEGVVVRDGVVHLESVVVNEPVPEDVDGDGDVDNDDLSAIAMKFGSTAADDLERYDLNGDGDIDTDDFAQVQSNLDSTVGSAPAASHTPQEQLRRIVERDNPGAVVRVVTQFPEKTVGGTHSKRDSAVGELPKSV